MAKRPPPPPTLPYVERAAGAYLLRYGTTVANLKRVLNRKLERAYAVHGGDRNEGRAWVESVVERLEARGYVNDEAYARSVTRTLVRRGVSSASIQRRLRTKGVEADLARACVREVFETLGESDLRAACRYVRSRRLGPYRTDPSTRSDRHKKDLARLGRAGFSYDVAKRTLDLPDPEAVEAIVLGQSEIG